MNKPTVIIIGVVLAVGFGSVVAWLLVVANTPANVTSTNEVTAPPTEGSATEQVPLNPNTTTDPNNAKTANVLIENSTFMPAKLTVKKGATVTWTNNDQAGQSVISDDNAPAGGPPKNADVLKQGETFSFTFDTVGTFPYHSGPNPVAQGAVEVTD